MLKHVADSDYIWSDWVVEKAYRRFLHEHQYMGPLSITVLEFITSTKVVCAIKDTHTREKFRYIIKKPGDRDLPYNRRWVSVLKDRKAHYIGFLDLDQNIFVYDPTSRLGRHSDGVITFESFWTVLKTNPTTGHYKVYNLGWCAICGRALTTRHHQEKGFHTRCWRKPVQLELPFDDVNPPTDWDIFVPVTEEFLSDEPKDPVLYNEDPTQYLLWIGGIYDNGD